MEKRVLTILAFVLKYFKGHTHFIPKFLYLQEKRFEFYSSLVIDVKRFTRMSFRMTVEKKEREKKIRNENRSKQVLTALYALHINGKMHYHKHIHSSKVFNGRIEYRRMKMLNSFLTLHHIFSLYKLT